MKSPKTSLCVVVALAGFVAATGVAAQSEVPACQNQLSLEQMLESNGDIFPDDCRSAQISRIESEAGWLCLIDFSGERESLLDDLRTAAVPEEWWFPCDALNAAR